MMDHVYRNGFRNLIYLGEDDGTVQAARDSIRLLRHGEISVETNRVGSLLEITHGYFGHTRMSSEPLRDQVDQTALANFCSRPWFR